MTVNRKRLNVKNAAASIALSAYKTRLCIIVAILMAFTSFTAFSTSQSKAFTIKDGTKSYSVISASMDASEIVNEAGLKLNQNDIASFGTEKNSDTISIIRRCEITVSVYGESKQFVAEQDTVGATLEKFGVAIGENDVITPAATEQIKDGITITVNKVTYREKTVTSLIGYNEYLTLIKSSSEVKNFIEKTDKKIQVTRIYKLTNVNDKEASSELKQQSFAVFTDKAKTVAKTTTAKVKTAASTAAKSTTAKKTSAGIAYNCKEAISPLVPNFNLKLDKNGVPVSYSKVIKGKGTAYSGGGWTASGKKAAVGYVAVDPKQIPYGTKLFIRSADGKYVYGYAIAADTGGFIHMGRTVDLYFNTESECTNFGVRNVEIYVLG